MVRDFARLQLFLRVAINFHSARSFFFSLSHDRDKLFNGEKRWRHFRTQRSRGSRYRSLVQRARAMLFFLLSPGPSPRVLGEPSEETRVSCSTPTGLYLRCPSAPFLHVTASAAILRIAPSRKRILRPQLRVQAILLLNVLRAWEPASDARVSTKWYSMHSQADRVYTRFFAYVIFKCPQLSSSNLYW